MTALPPFQPRGVIPACLLPFHADLSVDEAGLRAHLNDVAAVEGITAVTVNAHARPRGTCRRAQRPQKYSSFSIATGGMSLTRPFWNSTSG